MGQDLRMKLAATGALPLLVGAALATQFVLLTLLGVSETRGWLLVGEVLAAALLAVVLAALASRRRPRWMTVLGFLVVFLGLGSVLTAPSLSRPGRSRDWNVRHNRAWSNTGRACIALGAVLIGADWYRRRREKSASLSTHRR